MRGASIVKMLAVIGLMLTMPLQQVLATERASNPSSLEVNVKIRDIGYTLGDMLEMDVKIPLQHNEQLDLDSLPLVGPVKSWLDLTKLDVVEEKQSAQLKLTWQLFATVMQSQKIAIPTITLKTLTKPPRTILIPAQQFYMSSVLPLSLEDRSHRPNLAPLRFNSNKHLVLTLTSFALAIITAFIWAWWTDRLHFLPRHPGDLTQLHRHLRARKIAEKDVFSLTDLRLIHHALSSAASETLYPHTLHRLFEKSPYLLAHQEAIRQFFNASWQTIFMQQTPEMQTIDVKDTFDWIKNAAIAERLYQVSLKSPPTLSLPFLKREKTLRPN